jgi:hypothetical protein
MIMARRANIFLARVKRERSAMIKDFKRSIIGAAVHRRSTMARRRLAYTVTMVRRANTLLEQATDAVSQVQVSTRNFIRFQNKKTLLHHNDQYSSIQQEAVAAQQQNDITNDDYLLVHPNSKFDPDGFPLTSHVLTSGNLTDDEINYSSTEDDNSKSRRYINPWSISSCQHEPFINYLRWKWHQTFFTRDQTPQSLQDFMERTAAYISLDNNENIFSNQNLDNSFLTNHYSPPTTTTHWNPSSTNNIENRIKCTWIGHSTCLVQMHGVTILTDPVFSDVIGLPVTSGMFHHRTLLKNFEMWLTVVLLTLYVCRMTIMITWITRYAIFHVVCHYSFSFPTCLMNVPCTYISITITLFLYDESL